VSAARPSGPTGIPETAGECAAWTPPRTPSVSLSGLAARAIGVGLWRAADPRTLPVRTAHEAAPASAGSTRIIAVGLLVLAALVLAAGLHGLARTAEALETALVNRDHLSLLELAERLDREAASPLLAPLPGVPQGLRRSAASIRDGRDQLLAVAEAQARAATKAESLGLTGRLLRGRALVDPVAAALAGVRRPFHRGTLAYNEVAAQVTPYFVAPSWPVTLQGRLVDAPSGHSLALSSPLTAETAPRRAGEQIVLTLRPGDRLHLTAFVLRGGTHEIVEDWEAPIELWDERRFSAPRSAETFSIRFEPASLALAPPLRPLSRPAQAEIGIGALGSPAAE